jgi:hypothetical protein
MLQSPIASSFNQSAKFCSDESGSSSDGEAECDDVAAPEWLEKLLPLPLTCCVVSAVFPLPVAMNSRIIAASPDVACCNAVLGYVQVPAAATSRQMRPRLTLHVQCSEATGYSLHFTSQRGAVGIPLELNFTVTRHCPAVFSGDLLLVTDAWVVSSTSATRSNSYLEVARCHSISSAAHAQLPPELPFSPSQCSSCRGSVDSITSASTATGQPIALVRVCNATIAVNSKENAEHALPLVFVVIEHEAALSSLAWARCSSDIHLNALRPKLVSEFGESVKVFYSTPSTRCVLPTRLATPTLLQSSLDALYKATITGCICSGV